MDHLWLRLPSNTALVHVPPPPAPHDWLAIWKGQQWQGPRPLVPLLRIRLPLACCRPRAHLRCPSHGLSRPTFSTALQYPCSGKARSALLLNQHRFCKLFLFSSCSSTHLCKFTPHSLSFQQAFCIEPWAAGKGDPVTSCFPALSHPLCGVGACLPKRGGGDGRGTALAELLVTQKGMPMGLRRQGAKETARGGGQTLAQASSFLSFQDRNGHSMCEKIQGGSGGGGHGEG